MAKGRKATGKRRGRPPKAAERKAANGRKADAVIFKDEVWVTLDGRRVPVGELTLEHAHSIIRMVIRKQRAAQSKKITEAIDVLHRAGYAPMRVMQAYSLFVADRDTGVPDEIPLDQDAMFGD